jgi:hypothetical protein
LHQTNVVFVTWSCAKSVVSNEDDEGACAVPTLDFIIIVIEVFVIVIIVVI